MNTDIAVPKAGAAPLPELAAFLAPCAHLFRRSQSREGLERSVTGLLTDLPRKNCDTIAAAVAGTSPERLQHLLTDADWDPLALDEQRVRHLVTLSPPNGILAIDDTGLPKQGKASPGVARQYSGTLGKVGNCQIVVSAEYVVDDPTTSQPLHWPVSARLYLPQGWADDPVRRERAHVPPARSFATKITLALELIDRAVAWGVPFAAVAADAGYGSNPGFVAGLEARHLAYVVGIEKRFGLRLPTDVGGQASASPPPYSGRGRPRRVSPAPLQTPESLMATFTEDQWQSLHWRKGGSGSLGKQFVAVRVHPATGSAQNPSRLTTGPEGWLLVERPLPGEDGDTKYFLSNLPLDTSLLRLATICHGRWPIEQFYEDAKGECGLDDYQGRRWDGVHRHLALVMLTYCFLLLHRATPSGEGGFSPLRPQPVLPGGPSPDPRLAPAGPRPLVRRHQPDPILPPSALLT